MRSKVWHRLGATLLMIFAHTSIISCSSSEEQEGLTEEVSEGENAATQEGGENAEAEEGQGEEGENAASQEGGEEAQEGNNAAEGEEEVSENQVENEEQATQEGEQQGDLQEIIDDMNSSGGVDGNSTQAETLQQSPAEGENLGGEAMAEGMPGTNVPSDPAVEGAVSPDAASNPSVNAASTGDANAAAAAPVTDVPAPAPANDASGLPEMNAKMSYIVQKGDTLVKIAQKIYSDPTKWTEIASFTGLANPKMIYPGDVVYYQLNDSTKPFAMAYESVKRAEVQVQQGDTLSTIAGRVLGSNDNWKLIWRQNDTIDDPDKLMVGSTVYYVEPSALANAVTHFREVLAQQKQEASQQKIVSKSETAEKITVNSSPLTIKSKNSKTEKIYDSLPNSVDNEIEANLVSVNFVKNMNAARLI